MTGQVSKADGRRHTKHAPHYDNHFPKLAKRKDSNVRSSTRGKFESVEELVKHQAKTSKVIPHVKRQKLVASDHWTSRDNPNRDSFTREYLKIHAFNPAVSRIL